MPTSTTWSGSGGSAPRSRSRSASAPAAPEPSRSGCTTASVDAVVPARSEIDREQLRAVGEDRRSPLAALAKQAAPA
ncbi:hypothetical protein [Streptomyces sp. NPDC059452]|uniref:hypothetical protein n=1 Tax=Streptomyces sp. NPDC059452 TaxID=3346835 RepID=UPI00367E6196